MTVAGGAQYSGDNGYGSGHVRVFTYSPTANKWNRKGNTLLGAASNDYFGRSVSISADGMTFAAGAPYNDDNGDESGHVQIFRTKDIILSKEYGWCVNQFGNIQDDGKVKLSKESAGPSIEKQNRCRELCLNQGHLTDGSILTGCEAIWGQSSNNGCYMHTKQIARGDGTNKYPCWITVTEDADPFKPYELGFCQNSANKEATDTKDKTLLGTEETSYACMKNCIKEYEKVEIKKSISGCEYDENVKSCYLYNKIHWKATKGGYGGYDNAKKCWIKASYCVADSDCNDKDQCTIDTCDAETKECRYELSFDKCRTVGEPTALAVRVKAPDVETTMSLDEMKATIFGASDAAFSAKSQLNSCSSGKFQLMPYSGKLNNYAAIIDGVAEVNLIKKIIGEETASVERAILAAANEKYGNLESQVDLILLFVPAGTISVGTTEWKAYAC